MPAPPSPEPHCLRHAGAAAYWCAAASGGALALLLAAQQARAQEPQPPVQQGEEAPRPPATIPLPPPDIALPDVEPVIPDEEFEKRQAGLEMEADPQLEAPLETIEQFERRLAGETAEPTSEADASPASGNDGRQSSGDYSGEAREEDSETPATDPVADAIEQIGAAPIRDGELGAALPALESFEPQASGLIADFEEPEQPSVTYETELTGLEDLDPATAARLRSVFNGLSALRAGKGKAANLAQVSARLNEDSALIERILSSEGWYEPGVKAQLRRSGDGAARRLTAVIAVEPGARFTFERIVIEAPPIEPPGLIDDNLSLETGDPIIAARVLAAEAQVAVALRDNGYPFAELGARDILLDPAAASGVYTLPLDPGPRARFGEVRVTGDGVFDADHVALLARFERGAIYDESKIDDLRQALVATGLFSTVAIVPEQTGEPAPDGTQEATILVDQTAGPPRSLAASVGFETGQGFRVEGSWTHRNLFPPEGALIARGVAGTLEQGVGLSFRRSNAGRRDRRFQITVAALRSNFEAFEALTGRISALVSYDSTNLWRKPLTYAYGAQLIATSEDTFDLSRRFSDRRTFYIAGLTGQVGIDRTDSLLNPSRGYRATVLVEPEASLEGGLSPYLRAQVDASTYFAASDAITLAGRLRLGTIQGIDRIDLAPSRRFYAGGGGSVRGFGFQELGPRVPEANPDFDPDDPEETDDPFRLRPIGGRSLNEAAFELRYRFGDFGVVGFVDAGQVYADTLPDFSDLRYGVGLGARYYTSFGPFRFDVGIPVDRREGESAFSIYVSIGQAF